MSTLSMALEVAAVTVGFDLVATVVATGPMAMLTFVDYPYAGGKLGHIGETWQDGIGPEGENKPIYIMLKGDMETSMKFRDNQNVEPTRTVVTITGDNGVFTGIYMGNSRIDGSVIFQVKTVTDGESTPSDISIAQMFQNEGVFTTNAKDKDGNDIVFGTPGDSTTDPATPAVNVRLVPELVKGITDHIQSFSNFFGTKDGDGNVVRIKADEIAQTDDIIQQSLERCRAHVAGNAACIIFACRHAF